MNKPDKIRNIVLTLNNLAAGGAEKQCLLLASILQKYYNVRLFIIDQLPISDHHIRFLQKEKISHEFLTGNLLDKIKTLRSYFKDQDIDLIFSYLPRDIAVSSLAAIGLGKIHIGGIRNAEMESSKIKTLRFLHNYCLDASISNCHSGKIFFAEKGLREDKIHVIPNGINIEILPMVRDKSRHIEITSMGRLVEQKDFETALKSFAYLLDTLKGQSFSVHLNIIGQGPLLQKLTALLIQLDLMDQVSIEVHVKDLDAILRKTGIYLCTSLYEGVSNAIMEAMLYSLPIVATDVGDNNQLVQNHKNGYILQAKDHIGIGNALRQLVESYDQRIDFGQESYRLLKSNHHLDVFEARYLEFIKALS